ncbi:MAG: orotidine-5'-phosphate decarboxylase [Oscillospiraceae bacterium]|jgi:orotidine-5'-phosphate decarboxylase|nr:orotidine-5'-phosphate decarboxylase [Oscillospiraceae bacterium]
MSFDVLQGKIDALRNPAVVGLDPTDALVPAQLMKNGAAAAFLEFNKGLIDALCDIVPAVKPQLAYYERLGVPGVQALCETAEYARAKGMYVIADAKRGDVGSTAEAYSDAFLGADRPFDAVTVNGYLGSDGILPFLDAAKKYDKAIFVLVKTSNPSSGELQDLEVGGKKIYEIVGELIERIARDTIGARGFTRAGAVVGATYPAELKRLRSTLKSAFFLVPGYGAQGGGAQDAAGAFNAEKRGAIVNSSRAVIGAWKHTGNGGRDYQEAARAEALNMRGALRSAIGL